MWQWMVAATRGDWLVIGLALWLVALPGRATAPADPVARHGALYRITHEGKTSYLFGTIHVGTAAFYPLAPEVDSALAHAAKLVVELDTRDSAAFQRALLRHGSYTDGDTIAHHVSADTLARLTTTLHANGIPLREVAHYKPWLLANMLVGLELERNGYQRRSGNEFSLLDSASRNGTPVAELESADEQMAMFDGLGDADAESYLRENLNELADGRMLRKSRAIIDAWYAADAAGQDALLPALMGDAGVAADFMRRILLGKRNPAMAAAIEHIMHDTPVSFVGVGLLHLLGKQGLPQLLQQRGYQVERVY